MLRLIISPPGTGKTAHIMRKINSGAILIVPEQNHFETERMIYRKLKAKAFAGVNILSFTKLSEIITAKFNAVSVPYAEDTMREVTMMRAVRGLQEELTFYRQSDKPGFAARMLHSVGLFQREALSPQELAEFAGSITNPRLKAKISDLALIYEKYNGLLASGKFMDKQDEIRTAARLAREHNYFAGKSIFADGFDGFTGGQFKLLEIALEQASELTITLTADKFDSTDSRYITSVKLINKLKESAGKRRIEVTVEAPGDYVPERDPSDKTEIYLLPDVYNESSFVAAKIRELITTGNYSQSEIAVLNPPSPQVLLGAFEAYGLTGFSDIPESIIEKPIIRFIITVLDAAGGEPGKPDAVSELIRSGFIRISAA
ncbi:MAG: hypothetical protein LBC86_02575, partial [Oscillospiraceae bacterium]|nr:hypothetical protein [Oscillospiraceae bacterium]